MPALFCPSELVFGNLATWLAGIGTVATAIIAVWLARRSDRVAENRALRAKKEWVFATLMANRHSQFSPLTIPALNSIDVAFGAGLSMSKSTRGDRAVIEKWREILRHVDPSNKLPDGDPRILAWNMHLTDLYYGLLYEIAKDLDLHFEPSDLRNGGYLPERQASADREGAEIRQALLDIVSGKAALKVTIVGGPPDSSPPEAR